MFISKLPFRFIWNITGHEAYRFREHRFTYELMPWFDSSKKLSVAFVTHYPCSMEPRYHKWKEGSCWLEKGGEWACGQLLTCLLLAPSMRGDNKVCNLGWLTAVRKRWKEKENLINLWAGVSVAVIISFSSNLNSESILGNIYEDIIWIWWFVSTQYIYRGGVIDWFKGLVHVLFWHLHPRGERGGSANFKTKHTGP